MANLQRSIQIQEFNKQDPAASCVIVRVEIPKPGPNEVLLKMLCRPINPIDLIFLRGGIPEFTAPSAVGFEGMGVIHEVGESATKFRPGQRVYCYNQDRGTWQDYMLVSVDVKVLVKLPDTLPDEVGAQFFGNPWTVYGMLEELKVPKGEYILQTAAASVLGRMFIQLAKHRGIKTINLVRRNEQKAELMALGADVVINYKEEDVQKVVKEITGVGLAYAAIDSFAGDMTKLLASCVRANGTVLVYGIMESLEAKVDVADLLSRHVRIHGFSLGRYVAGLSQSEMRETEAAVMDLLERKVMEPLIGEKFDLDNFKEAITKSQIANRGGKILLT